MVDNAMKIIVMSARDDNKPTKKRSVDLIAKIKLYQTFSFKLTCSPLTA